MTEQDWLSATDPQKMLEWLRASGRLSERKARLFACACFRRVRHVLADEQARMAVEVAERYADGQATEDEREEALARIAGGRFGADATRWVLVAYARTGARMAVDAAGRTGGSLPGGEYDPARWEAERQGQCGLLRDSFGPSPFRQLVIAPSLLAWNGGTVSKLAQAAYEERHLPEGTLDPARLAVLADALEEAGCDTEGLLVHLRKQGAVHVRGCFVLDLLLNKE
jgi:hypothetical protein